MRQCDNGAAWTKRFRAERLVRPFVREHNTGKTFFCGKGRTRVNDPHGILSEGGHPGQRLGDVHRTDNREIERRIKYREKPFPPVDFHLSTQIAARLKARSVS